MKFIQLILFISILHAELSDGLIFISGHQSNISILIDNEENIVNSWNFDNNLIRSWLTSDSTIIALVGISGDRYLQKLSWGGITMWSYMLEDEICQIHHEIEILPNGNIVAICREDIEAEINYYNNENLVIDKIIEIQPLMDNQADIVWEWKFFDHLLQDTNPNGINYGIPFNNPQLFNINSVNNYDDFTHLNCIDYNPNLDQLVFSSRSLNEIFIIDHSTTTEQASGHSGGNYNMGGDFLYRWGNPVNYDRGDVSDQMLHSPHGVNWINNGYPGEGNIILFDNNFTETMSAVIEIQTPIENDGTYFITNGQSYDPESYIWIYNSDFYSDTNSGGFRLYNGNTFITSFEDSIIFEINQSGSIEWTYTGNLNTKRAVKYEYSFFDLNSLDGDLNSDGEINVIDVILIVNIILSGGYDPIADLNLDGEINVVDIIMIITIILS